MPDYTNPGSSNPVNQATQNVLVDQTRNVSACSASVNQANGEIQVLSGNTAQGTVTVSDPSGSVIQASGESSQRLDLKLPETSKSTGKGLAQNSFGHEGSAVKPMLTPNAVCFPTAITVAGGNHNPGKGLPVNVMIR